MAGFSVHPEALDHYAAVLAPDDGGGLHFAYLFGADDYNDEWVKLESGEGGAGLIFTKLVGATETVHDDLAAQNLVIEERLTDAALGLRSSATTYRNQEQASRIRLDKIYGTHPVVAADIEATTTPPDPKSALVEPSEDGKVVPDLVQQLLDGAGWFDAGAVVLKVIDFCGFDAVGWISDRLLGNFEAIAKVMNAVENLETFDEKAQEVIVDGVTTMSKEWHGNAADAARSYFDTLANGIDSRSTSLHKVYVNYDLILNAIQQAEALLERGLAAVIKAAVEAVAAVSAAGCLEEIPLVDLVADAVAGYKAYKVYKAIKDIYEIWDRIWAPHEGVLALITTLVGVLRSYDIDANLPARGYYNASQGGPPTPPRYGPEHGPR